MTVDTFVCIFRFYLGADLVAALAGLHVDDLAHDVGGGGGVGRFAQE